ncbi:MAG: type VI secretion system lipoprotein TssJ [Planctomycetes bacterium]|nr:type VI secretion system lipoprotein TssJ [Planctomycetota bacterium]
MRNRLMLLGLALALAVLAGCTSTTVTLDLVALKPVNEGKVGDATDGESRVVEVRVYQLKDDAKFKAATVEDVWTNAEEALGDSMIDVKLGESVFPEDANGQANGKQITIDPLDAGTKFIGILALFSNSDDGERKVVVPLDQADDVLFELTGYHITIKQQ